VDPPLTVSVGVTPKMISTIDPAEGEFKLRISNIPNPYKPTDINPTTIRICGMQSIIIRTGSPLYLGKRFYAQLDGGQFKAVVMLKAGHLIPEVKKLVDITVTGNFTNGQPFQGTLTVTVMRGVADPPPPP